MKKKRVASIECWMYRPSGSDPWTPSDFLEPWRDIRTGARTDERNEHTYMKPALGEMVYFQRPKDARSRYRRYRITLEELPTRRRSRGQR